MSFAPVRSIVVASALTAWLVAVAGASPAPASQAASRTVSQANTAKVGTRFGLPRISKLIVRRDVQREIALTVEQVTTLSALLKTGKAASQKPDETALAELDAQVGALLDKDQTKRMKEIQTQLAGLSAVFDAGIQTELSLTGAQKSEFGDLLSELQAKGCAYPTILETRLAAILTDDQETALAKLGGVLFVPDKVP